MLSAQSLQKIDAELAKYPADQRHSAVMAGIAHRKWKKAISLETIEFVADYIGIAPAAAYEVATFYNMLLTCTPWANTSSRITNLPAPCAAG